MSGKISVSVIGLLDLRPFVWCSTTKEGEEDDQPKMKQVKNAISVDPDRSPHRRRVSMVTNWILQSSLLWLFDALRSYVLMAVALTWPAPSAF